MSRFLPIFLAACAGPSWDLQERPRSMQAPGPQVLELVGPSTVYAGESITWVARGVDLQVGDTVELGWGGEEAPGPCVRRREVGGWLCLDIDNPVRPLASAVAEADPDAPGSAIALFEVVVPATSRPEIYLQALKADGLDSATTEVRAIQVVPEPDPCPSTDANIFSQADVALYEGCTHLNSVYLHQTSGVTDLSLPFLETVERYIYFHQNTDLQTVSLPRLREVIDPNGFEGYAYFHQNTNLTSVELGALESVSGYLYLSGNTSLNTLTFPSITNVDDYSYFAGNTSWCPDPAVDWDAVTANAVTNSGNGCP